MVIHNRGRYITLDDLAEDKIADDDIISVSRLAVSLRIVELSSSSNRNSRAKLDKLIKIVNKPSVIKHRGIIASYYMSAKDTRCIFEGMENAPACSFSISPTPAIFSR